MLTPRKGRQVVAAALDVSTNLSCFDPDIFLHRLHDPFATLRQLCASCLVLGYQSGYDRVVL